MNRSGSPNQLDSIKISCIFPSWINTNTPLHILDLIFKAAAAPPCNLYLPGAWKCAQANHATRSCIVEPKYCLSHPLYTTPILPSECCTNCSLGRIGVVSWAFSGFLLILRKIHFLHFKLPFLSALSPCRNKSG